MKQPVLAVCGCQLDRNNEHRDGCRLGVAEAIGRDAADEAERTGHHRLLTALAALAEVGALSDLDDNDPDSCLVSVLDALWERGLIDGSTS